MKFLYLFLLITSMAYSQAIDTINQVLFLFNNPNNSNIVGIHNTIQIGDSIYSFDKEFSELDSISTTKYGFWWSPKNPIKYFDLINWSSYYYNSNTISPTTDTCKMFLLGDFNNDNSVNGFDLNEFRKYFGRMGVTNLDQDMNGDGRVDGFDLNEFRKYFGRRWIPSCQ